MEIVPIKSNDLEFTECTLYAIGPDGQYHLLAKPLTTAEISDIGIRDKDIRLHYIYYANNNRRRMNGKRVYRRRAILRILYK